MTVWYVWCWFIGWSLCFVITKTRTSHLYQKAAATPAQQASGLAEAIRWRVCLLTSACHWAWNCYRIVNYFAKVETKAKEVPAANFDAYLNYMAWSPTAAIGIDAQKQQAKHPCFMNPISKTRFVQMLPPLLLMDPLEKKRRGRTRLKWMFINNRLSSKPAHAGGVGFIASMSDYNRFTNHCLWETKSMCLFSDEGLSVRVHCCFNVHNYSSCYIQLLLQQPCPLPLQPLCPLLFQPLYPIPVQLAPPILTSTALSIGAPTV